MTEGPWNRRMEGLGLSHAKLVNSEGSLKGSPVSPPGQRPPVSGGGGGESEAEFNLIQPSQAPVSPTKKHKDPL